MERHIPLFTYREKYASVPVSKFCSIISTHQNWGVFIYFYFRVVQFLCSLELRFITMVGMVTMVGGIVAL